MEKNNSQEKEINILKIIYHLWLNRNILYKTILFCFILGSIIAYSLPKKYTVFVNLSPESGKNSIGNFAGMASILGMNMGNISNDPDAINITLFPEIIASTPFALELYNMKILTDNLGEIKLCEYIQQQKSPWWSIVFSIPNYTIKFIKSFFTTSPNLKENNTVPNPFKLTSKESNIIKEIKNSISATTDKKSGITSISVTLQDPIVTAIVADSVISKLQNYIINYRTKKAREDYNNLTKLFKEHQKKYYILQQKYATYIDENKKISQQKARIEGERIKNEMDIAFQIYNQISTQQQIARTKIEEDKPVFAIVEPATIPLTPSSPNKLFIILSFAVLGVLISSAWILFGNNLWKDIIKTIQNKN